MKTLLAVARVEFLLLLRDKRFIAAAVALWLMVGAVLTLTQTRFLAEQQQLRAAQQISRVQWQTRTGRSGHALGHYGTYAYRQANPLSVLHPGADPYVGVAAHIVAHQQTNMFYRPMLDRASIDRWADVSATTLLQIVIPLLLLLAAFTSIAGDREDGRLKLFLGQGPSPTLFALGKLAGLIAVAAVLLLPAFVVATLLLVQAARTLGGLEELTPRLLALYGGYGAFYLFFLATGIAISALCQTRQNALLACLGLWAVLCLVTPRLFTLAAEQRFPTPEEDVVQAQIDLERKDRRQSRALRKRVEEEALRRYKVKTADELPVRLDALMLQAGEEHTNAINDRHMGKVWSQFAAQEAWVARFGSAATPLVSLRNLSETVSNTDPAALRGYVFAIENFRRDWVRRLNEADAHRPRRNRSRGERIASRGGHDHQHQPWADFPPFDYQPPTLSAVRPQVGGALTVLWAWAGLGLLAAVFCVRVKSGVDHV